jgi:hypothetical protein
MRYVIANTNFSGTFDSYEIIEYSLNKTIKSINFRIQKITINLNGVPETTIAQNNIIDIQEIIIDPAWNESSTPHPKPAGFDFSDPTTWETLSWDDIPKTINPEKLYVTKIINSSDPIEKGIIENIIALGKIPAGGNFA